MIGMIIEDINTLIYSLSIDSNVPNENKEELTTYLIAFKEAIKGMD